MRVLKNKPFSQWAKKLRIADSTLITAIDEMKSGLYEANLGGHIYKKRIPLGHRGKSGGARTIIAYKANDKVIFMYGFSKGEKGNITRKEEEFIIDSYMLLKTPCQQKLDGGLISLASVVHQLSAIEPLEKSAISGGKRYISVLNTKIKIIFGKG